MNDSAANPKMRISHWLILLAILAAGTFMRFYEIGKESLWGDEFWSVYISMGRGDEIFQVPEGKIIDPPPPATLANALPWWDIWTGMKHAVHPPLYHIVLRWWMDVFGEGDAATRTLSAVLSLAGILVFFDTIRRTSGIPPALIAAAIMSLAISQIDFSQLTRSYTMIVFLGLIACNAVVRIQQLGSSPLRLFQLGAAVFTSLLSHYFTVFTLAGLGAYVLFHLRGPTRIKILATMFVSAILAAIVWGPFAWQQHQNHLMEATASWATDHDFSVKSAFQRLAILPVFHLVGNNKWEWDTWLMAAASGAVVFVVPLLLIRRKPQLMLWWWWTVAGLGLLALFDIALHTHLALFPKYSFLATPGICAIVASPLAMKRIWLSYLIPGMFLASILTADLQRYQDGPPRYENWRPLMKIADRVAGKHDPIIFCRDPGWGAPLIYTCFAHYAPDSQRPIMLLPPQTDAQTLHELAGYPRIFLLGRTPIQDGPKLLPGWKIAPGGGGVAYLGFVAPMVPIAEK